MSSASPENSSISKGIAILTLATLSFLGGCRSSSQPEPKDEYFDARASSTAKADLFQGLPPVKGSIERKIVSLNDASSNTVSLDPRLDYLVEVPYGTFKEVSESIVSPTNGWISGYKTDDIYIFDVPKNPSQYAIKIEIQNFCEKGAWSEYDGTYLFLINMADGSRISSAVKLPVKADFTSQAKNHGKLVLIRSEEDGKVFEVPTPRLLKTNDRHFVPRYIEFVQDKIVQRQPVEKL